MQLREHPKPYKFFATFERMEPLILDHTAMIAWKECKRKYFFQIVLGSVPRGETAPYFIFGAAYHKFREVLEQRVTFEGVEVAKAYPEAMAMAIQHYNKGLPKGVAAGDKWDFMTLDRLITSCKKAYEWWKTEKASNKIVVLAVEQPFNVEIVPGSGEYTSGRFDQIVRWNGKIWGRDFKTTSKEGMFYTRGLTPNDQFTRYTFAEAELSRQKVEGQIIETLYNSKKSGPILTPYTANRPLFMLEDWKRDEMMHREWMAMSRERDIWPKEEKSCGFCQFHSVCAMNTEGAAMAKLKQEFTQRPWDNMTVHLVD